MSSQTTVLIPIGLTNQSSLKQPANVLVFFTDQQRWDTVGAQGNPLGLTPHFDRLCTTGTQLVNHFTCQPVCGPARACLQTGLYATQNGCFNNGVPLRRDLPTLATLFKAGGYETGYIGKWHLSDAGKGAVPQEDRGGYDYWLGSNLLEFTSEAYDTLLYDGANQPVRLPGYRVDALADAAIRYMVSPREKPYFLFLSFLEPHHQNNSDSYPAPDGYEALYTGRWIPPDLVALGGSSAKHLGGYCGMVKRLDEAFGRILDVLKSRGELDNTLILFTSDHGCHFKTRNNKYKRSCHESSLRVPALLHGPGFQRGVPLNTLTSLIDLPPTLLDAAGLPVPDSFAGRSLLPEIAGSSTRTEEDDFIIAQISGSQHGRTIRTRHWKYAVSAPWTHAPNPDAYTESHLYDLRDDPHELNNLIDNKAFASVATSLRNKLTKALQKLGEPAVPIT